MTSAALTNSEPEILLPQSKELVALDQQVRQVAKTLRTSTMSLAHFGFRLRYQIEGMGGDWAVLQMPLRTSDGERIAQTEDEYRAALGVGRSTYYKALRIGESLRQLKLADMEQITVENAELLILVDPAIVPSFPWVEEAKVLSSHEFAIRVAQRNRKVGGAREPTTRFSVKVPITAKKFLEETVESFRLEHELATSGEALEMLIADVHDRPNIMVTLRTIHQLVEWSMNRINKNSKEFAWLQRASIAAYKAYDAARNEVPHEENAKAVYTPENLYGDRKRPTGIRSVSTKPYGSDGPSQPGRPAMEGPSDYLHPLLAPDEFNGSDDGTEGGLIQ